MSVNGAKHSLNFRFPGSGSGRRSVSNMLVHREYTDAAPATLTVYRDRVETQNPAIPHGRGPIRPGHFTPFPKNPTLSKFFMQMGRGEELGSGVLNVNKYLPFYTKRGKARFIEGDPFVTVIPLPTETTGTPVVTDEKTGVKPRVKTRVKTGVKTSVGILDLARSNPSVSREEMAKALELTLKGIDWQVARLKKAGHLRRVGPDKGGHWEVLPPAQAGQNGG